MSEIALNYRVEGQGPALLLVHGFGISFNIWAQMLPLLRPHFKLVMIELPGIGASPLPLDGQHYLPAAIEGIEAVRTSLGLKQWSVLGYSSGSRIAEAYVQAHAKSVCRAVFLCPVTMGVPKTRALRLGLWLDRSVPALGTWILGGWRLRFLISWLGFNLAPDPRTRQWYEEIHAAPVCVLKETLRVVYANAAGDFSVPVPYAMIWGDRDLVPMKPKNPGEHDYFVHGRHAAPVEAAQEVAHIIVSLPQDCSTQTRAPATGAGAKTEHG